MGYIRGVFAPPTRFFLTKMTSGFFRIILCIGMTAPAAFAQVDSVKTKELKEVTIQRILSIPDQEYGLQIGALLIAR